MTTVAGKSKKSTKILLTQENDHLRKRTAIWRSIGAIASRMSHQQPLDIILNEAVRECAHALSAERFCIFFIGTNGNELEVNASVGLDIDKLRPLPLAEGETLISLAKKGLPSWIGLSSTDEEKKRSVCIPLICRDISLGILAITRSEEEEPFRTDDLRVINILANQIAIAAYIEFFSSDMMSRERMEREYQFSQAVRSELLPRTFPAFANYLTGVRSFPSIDMGGDFYDAVQISNELSFLVIGETSGRGMRAALNLTHLISSLRGMLATRLSLAEVIAALNEELIRHGGRGQMVSLCLIEVNNARQIIRLARIGSTGSVIVRASGEVERLSATNGTPLGVVSDYHVDIQEIVLGVGEALLCSTDGLHKAETEIGETGYWQHLCEVLQAAQPSIRGAEHSQMVSVVADYIGTTTGLRCPEDDLTILSLERPA